MKITGAWWKGPHVSLPTPGELWAWGPGWSTRTLTLPGSQRKGLVCVVPFKEALAPDTRAPVQARLSGAAGQLLLGLCASSEICSPPACWGASLLSRIPNSSPCLRVRAVRRAKGGGVWVHFSHWKGTVTPLHGFTYSRTSDGLREEARASQARAVWATCHWKARIKEAQIPGRASRL